MKKFLLVTIWFAITMILIIVGYFYYYYQSQHPSTDDAYVQANTIQIAAQVTGQVADVDVKNNQWVKKGQLLFRLDARPFQYALAEAVAHLNLVQQQIRVHQAAVQIAKANLAEAQDKYAVAFQNVPRTLKLVKADKASQAKGVSAQGQLRETKAALGAADDKLIKALAVLGPHEKDSAALLAAKAQLAEAKLKLEYSIVTAPESGFLTNFHLQPGSTVIANQPLFALIENNQWWIRANYKETALIHIHNGQSAKIVLDMYPNHVFHGYVQSISFGSGSAFAILPPENASGNWVKVVQRFPVKISIRNQNANFPLRLGASAHVTINTIPIPLQNAKFVKRLNVF